MSIAAIMRNSLDLLQKRKTQEADIYCEHFRLSTPATNALNEGVKQGYELAVKVLDECEEKQDVEPLYRIMSEESQKYVNDEDSSFEGHLTHTTKMQFLEYLDDLFDALCYLSEDDKEQSEEIRQQGNFDSQHFRDIMLLEEQLAEAEEERPPTLH